MKITRVIALAVIAASGGVATLHAQSLRNASEPAEFPPASYKSTQYVDSRGCVFVRAGISGNVTWVPRVNRSRKQLCNQKPSLSASARVAAPVAAAAKPPVQITLDTPVAATPAAPVPKAAKPKVRKPATVAATKPRVVKKPVVRRAPVRTAAAPIKIIPAKTPVKAKPAAKPVAVQKPAPVVRRQTACAGASAVSQRYMSGGNVRCGPQAQVPYSQGSAVQTRRVAAAQPTARGQYRSAPSTGRIDGSTRVVPKHVLIQRQNTQNLPVPKGYRTVWEDDRLNPRRAEQSLAGQAAVKWIWTSTIPRRLVEVGTGRDVTSKVPLVYPYVDVSVQARELGHVTIVRQNGQVLKRIQRKTFNTYSARQPTISSRSAPKAAAPKAVPRAKPQATGSGVIQVGTYGSHADAQAVAKRIQRMGLPVRIGKYQRGTQTYRMVLAGPFANNASQQLNTLRRAGYANARLR